MCASICSTARLFQYVCLFDGLMTYLVMRYTDRRVSVCTRPPVYGKLYICVFKMFVGLPDVQLLPDHGCTDHYTTR